MYCATQRVQQRTNQAQGLKWTVRAAPLTEAQSESNLNAHQQRSGGVMHMWEYYSVKKQWNLDTYHAVNESEDTKLSERSRGWRWGGKIMCNELFLAKHSEEVALQRRTLLICISRAWEENGIGNGGCWKRVSFRGGDGVLGQHGGGGLPAFPSH